MLGKHYTIELHSQPEAKGFLCFHCFETGCHYVVQAVSKLMAILQPQHECWDYTCAPPHPSRYGLLRGLWSQI